LSRRKMSAPDRSYGWYKAHCFNDYMERVIGEYGDELWKMVFNDESTNTDYLDCVKFCADLVWHEYQVKQEEAHPRPDTALVNTDVLDTVLLSLHPAEVVEASEEVSQRSKEGLAQLHRFYALIKLEKVEEEEMKALLENLPDEYAAMLALMCWFVTLASKMTGIEIPGVGMAPGGKIVKPEQEVKEHLFNMVLVAEAMSASMHWNFLAQYSILKEMLADLRIIATTWEKQAAAGSATEDGWMQEKIAEAKETLKEVKEDAQEKVAEAKENIQEKLAEAMETLEELKEDTQEKVAEAKENVREKFADAKETLKEVKEDAQEKVAEAKEKVKEMLSGTSKEEEEEEDMQSGGSATVLFEKEMQKEEGKEVKDVENKDEEEKPAWIRKLEEFVAGLWWWEDKEEEANANSSVPTLQRSMGAEAPAHQEAQPGGVEEQLEQFEKQLGQLEEQLEEHVHDAAAHEQEEAEKIKDGGQAPAAVQEEQEEMENEQVDRWVVEQLHHAYRLGGHGAAAMALWWLEEGSTNGFHFDQAATSFQGLPSEVKERFLWRAILIMHNHPLEEENNGEESGSQE